MYALLLIVVSLNVLLDQFEIVHIKYKKKKL